MAKNILIALGVAVLIYSTVVSSVLLFGRHTGSNTFSASTGLNSVNLTPGTDDTYSVAVNGTAIIGTTGLLSSNAYTCATATYHPGTLGPYNSATSTTSTNIGLTGSVMGDFCFGSLTSATSSAADVACDITSNGTATLQLYNDGTSALTLATGTAKVCFVH